MTLEEMLSDVETINANLESIKEIVKEAKQDGDWDKVEYIQKRMLEFEPQNERALTTLVLVAKQRKDYKRED